MPDNDKAQASSLNQGIRDITNTMVHMCSMDITAAACVHAPLSFQQGGSSAIRCRVRERRRPVRKRTATRASERCFCHANLLYLTPSLPSSHRCEDRVTALWDIRGKGGGVHKWAQRKSESLQRKSEKSENQQESERGCQHVIDLWFVHALCMTRQRLMTPT